MKKYHSPLSYPLPSPRPTVFVSFIFILFLTLTTGSVFAQYAQVMGKVTDNQGAPLPGVTVNIKGSSQGTTTDIDGHFSIPEWK
jgi:hypothetical protein